MTPIKFNKLFISLAFALTGFAPILSAQAEGDHFLLSRWMPYIFIAIVVAIIGYAARTIYKLTLLFIKVREDQIRASLGLPPKTVAASKESWWDKFYKNATDAVPVEREADVMLDHNYDGIQELDNNLPPWWLWMFYITIGIGVLYFGYYHMSPYGKSSTEQYEFAMAQAAAEVEAYKALQSDVIDETNLTVLDGEDDLEIGRGIFLNNCAACHLATGAGSVGPNLTDNYWLHGGSIQDVFKTVKYGVPEKGMISWQTQLRPKEMHQVSSYILAKLHGTNPPDAKAPQGDLYEPDDSEPAE